MRSECINLVIFFLRSRSFIFQSALPVKQPETPKQENAKKKKDKIRTTKDTTTHLPQHVCENKGQEQDLIT